MNNTPVTVTGYVVALPSNIDQRQSRVAIVQDGVEHRVVPRGAGMDLVDDVSVQVEATGLLENVEIDGQEVSYIHVRGYKVLDDDAWGDG
ncbi:MAG: hypothetical protein LBR22_04440 [Desulfovibrio sp.]|jgi:hypothetical protein|nr:hypothetical protein [Desulfovibrio sp.]